MRALKLFIWLLLLSPWFANAQQLQTAEYFYNSDPGLGMATPLAITQGDTLDQNFTIPLTGSGLSNGLQVLYVRIKDSNGHWSHVTPRFFYISQGGQVTTDLAAMEYFFDTDPGQGAGIPIPVGSPSDTFDITLNIPVSGLSEGFHNLYVRAKNQANQWSLVDSRMFYLVDPIVQTYRLVRYEYFFDTDPGTGNAVSLTANPSLTDTLDESYVIPINSLSLGFHNLYVRAIDENGRWSMVESRMFYINSSTIPQIEITGLEYFFDQDPGQGLGTAIPVPSTADTQDVNIVVPINGLSLGFHNLYVRARNEDGNWSMVDSRMFYINSATIANNNLVQFEYFFDQDPGFGAGIAIPLPGNNDSAQVAINIPINTLGLGFHNLYVRAKNADNNWSHVDSRMFYITDSNLITNPQMVALEYYIDTDPGFGLGTDIPISQTANVNQNVVIALPNGLAGGFHHLYVRALDQNGKWSLVERRVFEVRLFNISFNLPQNDYCPGNNFILPFRATGTYVSGNVFTAEISNNSGSFANPTQVGTFTNAVGGNLNMAISLPNNLAPGLYSIRIRSSNLLDTSSIASFNINPIPVETLSASGPTTICAGSSVVLTSSAATGNAWFRNNVAMGLSTQSITVTQSGSYHSRVTTLGCVGGTDTLFVSVVQGATPPVITADNSLTVCVGDNLNLNSSYPSGNQWYLNGDSIIGATGVQHAVTLPGVYTVGVNTGLCYAFSSPVSVTFGVPLSTPTINAQSSTTICAGTSVNLQSTSAPSYQWYRNNVPIVNATSQVYAATLSGVYHCKATSADACESSSSNTIEVFVEPAPITPNIAASGNTTFCTGNTIQISTTSTESLQWFKDGIAMQGETGQSITVGTSGNYYVVATLGNCSRISSSIAVNVIQGIAQPTIAQGSLVNLCTGQTIQLTSSYASGNQWFLDGNIINGATAQGYTATTTGVYTVTVSAAGCQDATSAGTQVNIFAYPTQPTINVGGAMNICEGTTVDLTSSSSTGNQWYNNGGIMNGQNGQVLSVGTSGNYRVDVTENGCTSSSANVFITVTPTPANPVISALGATAFCEGDSVKLSSSYATGNQWLLNGNPITDSTAQILTVRTTGVYSVVTTIGGCVKTSGNIAVTVTDYPDPATVSANGPTTFCFGLSVTLEATGTTGTIQWMRNGSLLQGAFGPTYVASIDGDYGVRVSNGNCLAPASNTINVQTIQVPAVATIVTSGATTFCDGDSVILSNSLGAGSQWYLDGNQISGATGSDLIVKDPGVYSIITGGATCTQVSTNSVTVTVNPYPAIPTISTQGSSVACGGTSVLLTASPSPNYQWNQTGQNLLGAINQTLQAAATGQYRVSTTVNGCTSTSDAVLVTIVPSNQIITPVITVNGGGIDLCPGESRTLSLNTLTGNQWYKDGIELINDTSQALVITNTGAYSARHIANQCTTYSQAVQINLGTTPAAATVVANGVTQFCDGGSVELEATGTSGSYQWYRNGNVILGAISNTFIATTSGDYSVGVSNGFCQAPASNFVNVDVINLPAQATIIANGATTFCADDSVILSNSLGAGIQWYLNGQPILGATGSQIIVKDPGFYTIISGSGLCAVPSSNTVEVIVNPYPTIPTITVVGDTNLCSGSSAELISSSAPNYFWNQTGTTIPGATGQTLFVNQTGQYRVSTNLNGCISTSDAVLIYVSPAAPVPSINYAGSNTFCDGESRIISSSIATGNQWFKNGNLLVGETNQSLTVTTAGIYSVVHTAGACSANSQTFEFFVNPIPITPSIVANGTVNICPNSSVELTSTLSFGSYQWYENGIPIPFTNSQSLIVNTNRTFTVRTTELGCTSAESNGITVTIQNVPGLPTIVLSGSTNLCEGDTLTLTSSQPTGNQWTFNGAPINGATDQTLKVFAQGNYSLQTAPNACNAGVPDVQVFVYPVPPKPSIIPSSTTICDNNAINMVSSVNVGNQWYRDGGAIPFATQTSYGTAIPGVYSVQISLNGCTSQMSDVLVINASTTPPIPTISSNIPLSHCAGNSLELTSSAIANNQWFLNGDSIVGAQQVSYSVPTAGFYQVAVSNAGCVAISTQAEVIIRPLPGVPTIINNGATSLCSGSTIVLESSFGDFYQWLRDGNAIPFATGSTFQVALAGDYQVVVSNGFCSDTSAISTITGTSSGLSVSISPTGTFGTITICDGDSITLTSSQANNIAWFRDNSPLGLTTQSISASSTGNYYVVFTDNGCQVGSNTVLVQSVLPPAKPNFTLTGTLAFCSGGSTTINADVFLNNQWYDNGSAIPFATGQSYTATDSGSIYLLINNGVCTVSSDTLEVFSIIPPSTPSFTSAASATICAGDSLELEVSNPQGTIQWYVNNQIITGANSASYFAKATGNYSVRYAIGPCVANSGNYAVTVLPLPQAPSLWVNGPTTVCAGSTVTLISSLQNTYLWFKDGVQLPNGLRYLNVTQSGNYYAAFEANGCIAYSDTIPIEFLPGNSNPLVTPLGPIDFCQGDSVVLESNQATGNLWYFNGMPLFQSTADTVVVIGTGYYSVRQLQQGCNAVSPAVFVNVRPVPASPTLTVTGATSFCEGGSITLNSNQLTMNQWYKNGIAIPGETNQFYNADSSGLYSVAAVQDGCPSFSNVVNVTVLPAPIAEIAQGTSLTWCETQGALTLNATDIQGQTYQWYRNGNMLLGENLANLAVNQSGTYRVEVGGSNTCTSQAVIEVRYSTEIVVDTQIVAPLCINGNTGFVTLTVSGGNQPYRYAWSNGQMGQNLIGVTPGIYSVTVLDTFNCSKTVQVIIPNGTVQCDNGTRYVAVNGNNAGNTCLDSLLPCATIQYAVDVAIPGDTIQVFRGLYPIATPVTVGKSNILFRGPMVGELAIHRSNSHAEFGREALLRTTGSAFVINSGTNNITFDGFSIEPANNSNTSALISANQNNNVIVRNTILGATNVNRWHNGVMVDAQEVNNFVFERNWIQNMQANGLGVHILGGSNATIAYSRQRVSNFGDFVSVQNHDNLWVHHNEIDRSQYGLQLGSNLSLPLSTRGVRVSDNTFTTLQEAIEIENGASNAIVVENNTIISLGLDKATIKIADNLVNTTGTRFNENRIFSANPAEDYVIYTGNMLDFTCNYWNTPVYSIFGSRLDAAVNSSSIQIFPFLTVGTSTGMQMGYYPIANACDGVDPAATAPNVFITGGTETQKNSIKLYPNPARNYALLDLSLQPGSYELTLKDITGKLISTKVIEVSGESATLTEVINLETLRSGVYMVNLKGSNVSETQKLVVQK